MLEFPNGIIVLFNELWQITDMATDVDGSGWIGHLHRLENGVDALVGLELLRNSLNHESSGIERVHVLGGTEPDGAHADHGAPVGVYEGKDDKGNDISHDYMSP